MFAAQRKAELTYDLDVDAPDIVTGETGVSVSVSCPFMETCGGMQKRGVPLRKLNHIYSNRSDCCLDIHAYSLHCTVCDSLGYSPGMRLVSNRSQFTI